AEETNCDMFIAGCEMVQAERRADEWRTLIADVRNEYTGPITYNTDKYQEDRASWWDAVDVVSSSGYYAIDDGDNELDRIEKVVKTHNKPLFFAEAGCTRREGSSFIPNNWELEGSVNLKEQEDFYRVMFEKTKQRDWIKGFGLWDWNTLLADESSAINDDG